MGKSNKSWSVVNDVTGHGISNVLSDSGAESLADDVERDALYVGYGFCDCEAADTEWTVLDVTALADGVQVTLKDYYGNVSVLLYG